MKQATTVTKREHENLQCSHIKVQFSKNCFMKLFKAAVKISIRTTKNGMMYADLEKLDETKKVKNLEVLNV